MNEKDPLGEKMRMKERAEEDQYFAARDRELMAKLKHQQEVGQPTIARERARARCPDCGDLLHPHPAQHGITQECPTCHGVWLSSTRMATTAQQQGLGWTEQFLAEFIHLLEHPRA